MPVQSTTTRVPLDVNMISNEKKQTRKHLRNQRKMVSCVSLED